MDSWKMSRDVDLCKAKMDYGGHENVLPNLFAGKSSVGSIVNQTSLFIHSDIK